MRLFDLVFIACFLIAVILCLRIGWLALRRRREAAFRNLKRLSVFVFAYLAVVIVVGFLRPQHVFQVGDTRCFDDWCICVESVNATRSIGTDIRPIRGRFLLITLRVSSRARGIRQSEPYTRVYLRDADGNRYQVADAPQQAFDAANGKQFPIGTMLDPGESFTTVRVFDIPPDLPEIGLALRSSGPGLLIIIGDDASLCHMQSIFRIPIPPDQ